MVATVEDGKVTQLRPDPDHPLSKGYACPKGIAMTEVQNDPDRVLHPLRKNAAGEFERVSWDEALDDIGERLRATRDEHGPNAIAWYMGNPGAFSYSHTLWAKGFVDGLGSRHYYGAGSQDVNNRFAASALLYGSPLTIPIPDINRTGFLLMVGANPLVSHGSVLSAPRIRELLNAIVDRGGRVVVVDPRRSETARAFEHVAINPDADAWMLLSMLQVLFDEGLADRGFLARHATGAEELERVVAEHTPAVTEGRTGIPSEQLRQLTRDFAAAPGAAAYGRTGSCLGRFGTLVSFLLDAVNAVAGKLDRPGGAVFGNPPIALDEIADQIGLATYDATRSRIGDFPDVLGALPASLLPQEIETPGEGQIRAMFVSAGNPVLSVPNGDALERALGELDLLVSLDFYVNETNKHADYVLPSTTWLERDDMPLAFLTFYSTPFINQTDAVVEPAGEAREEWEIIDQIARRVGVAPYSMKPLRALARAGIRMSPQRMVDNLLRVGRGGDRFGLRRGGLSRKKLRENPHGIVLADQLETGVLVKKVRHESGRLALAPLAIQREIERLAASNGHHAELPLRLIGLRELRSHNSWMHNAPLLMRGEREHALRVHPDDAAAVGLDDGAQAQLSSKAGSIQVPVKVTDEMTPGTVALPHGWGHRGGSWQLANEHGGANINLLAGSEPEDLEKLAGMAFLNGIPVRLEPVTAAEDPAAPESAAEPVSA